MDGSESQAGTTTTPQGTIAIDVGRVVATLSRLQVRRCFKDSAVVEETPKTLQSLFPPSLVSPSPPREFHGDSGAVYNKFQTHETEDLERVRVKCTDCPCTCSARDHRLARPNMYSSAMFM